MAGRERLGLTSQNSVAIACGAERISVGNPARPYTSDRYAQLSGCNILSI